MIATVVVTTDSTEIVNIARRNGADLIIERPTDLATDETPLSPVIQHAHESVSGEYDLVASVQPTAPLISTETLAAGIRTATSDENDSVIFVRDSTHIFWQSTADGMVPVNDARKNRQQLNRIYEEVGIFITEASLVTDGRRVGDDPAFQEVGQREGVDIDTYNDWLVAENYLNRLSLCYVVTGNTETGLGHVYRALTIADNIFRHDLEFAVFPNNNLAIELIEQSNYPYCEFSSQEEFVEYVRKNDVDVVVNDILNTEVEYVRALSGQGARVVNIEDIGPGSKEADAVINALYEYSNPSENHYYGYQYFCLRNEFRYVPPKEPIESVDCIMIAFGGTDIQNLTERTIDALTGIETPLHLDVVLGPGNENMERVQQKLNALDDRFTAELNQEVAHMSDHFRQADLLITSNGRTVYEAASVHLPTITIAQNDREERHLYAQITNGVTYLGNAEYVVASMIQSAVKDYIADPQRREMMRQSLADDNIGDGVQKIIDIILNKNESPDPT